MSPEMEAVAQCGGVLLGVYAVIRVVTIVKGLLSAGAA